MKKIVIPSALSLFFGNEIVSLAALTLMLGCLVVFLLKVMVKGGYFN